MTTGVFALLGVLLGGLVTAGVQLFLKGREQRTQRQLAARVVWGELVWFRSGVSAALRSNDGGLIPPSEPLSETWRQHRDGLASFLPLDPWATVLTAVLAAVELAKHKGTTPGPWPDKIEDVLRDVEKRLEAGSSALHPFLG